MASTGTFCFASGTPRAARLSRNTMHSSTATERKSPSTHTPESTLTFESATSVGKDAIIEKLKNLPFGRVQHQVETLDAQLNASTNTYMVLVTGRLLVDEEQRPMTFTQFFLIAPNPHTAEPNFAARKEEEIYIHSDIFKLIFP
ncbi:hypothetical protein F5X99DRAFT_408338 [Biscogniauxia marginata]|nr:hypothetical protein F5X99DRAFT_408338 [Biscogniauxia marginata]